MDSLTHILVGHAMGAVASSVSPDAAAAVYWAALIGNSLPDIDVPVSLVLRRGIKLHRTLTHTIPGVVLLSALIAGPLTWIYPGVPFALVFAWALLGNLTHLGMDCLNLFGARPFWPFTARSVELGVLHILDPVLVSLLGAAAVTAGTGVAPKGVLILSFVGMLLYIVHRLRIARRLIALLKREGSVRARVIPWFSSWRYVFETDGAIEFGRFDRGRRLALSTFQKLDSPLVRASRSFPQVVDFLEESEYPYALVREDEEGHAVIWADVVRQLRADFQPLIVRVD